MIETHVTHTQADPLQAPMFRTAGGTSWSCGWCYEVCRDEFWVEQHRQSHRNRLENFLVMRAEQHP